MKRKSGLNKQAQRENEKVYTKEQCNHQNKTKRRATRPKEKTQDLDKENIQGLDMELFFHSLAFL